MATYILVNRHRPEECESLSEEAQSHPFGRRLEGTAFLCTCPSGEHGATFAVEAGNEAGALALLPPKFRAATRAYIGDVMQIGQQIPVA